MSTMATVAEQLRLAREAQHLTVVQVAETTKIRTDHVRALEEGNYEIFSAPVYIRGFVRTYAKLLKLDAQEVLATLDQELAQTEKFREPPSLPHASANWLDFLTLQLSRAHWRVIALAALACVLFWSGMWGYRFWRARHTADPLRQLGPGMYQAPTNAPGDTLPLPTNAPPGR